MTNRNTQNVICVTDITTNIKLNDLIHESSDIYHLTLSVYPTLCYYFFIKFRHEIDQCQNCFYVCRNRYLETNSDCQILSFRQNSITESEDFLYYDYLVLLFSVVTPTYF